METEPDKARRDERQPRSNVVKVLHWGDNPPVVVALIGADRFKTEFLTANRALTLAGHIVLMPGVFGNADGGFLNPETKRKIDELQLKKIDMSDMVYVVNPNGFTNEVTKREIEYAESLGKQIRYYESR